MQGIAVLGTVCSAATSVTLPSKSGSRIFYAQVVSSSLPSLSHVNCADSFIVLFLTSISIFDPETDVLFMADMLGGP